MPQPGCFPPPPKKETQYQWYRGLGGPQDRAGQVQNILLPPGFDPWTIQLVESCYTDYAVPAHSSVVVIYIVISSIAVFTIR
jgi:hypothetical protein